MNTVLSGTRLDDTLDATLGLVSTALNTLGLGDILPTVDNVVDLVADQVLSNPATLTIHINPGQENITITTDSGSFLQGSSGDDTLTGDSSSNTAIFYNLINTDPTGGNGKDTWTNFTLGDASVENSGADKIDISNLLIGYEGDGSTGSLADYLKVESANGDTTIKIDRDGSDDTYQSTDLMVLKGVEATLDQLNQQNHQIII